MNICKQIVVWLSWEKCIISKYLCIYNYISSSAIIYNTVNEICIRTICRALLFIIISEIWFFIYIYIDLITPYSYSLGLLHRSWDNLLIIPVAMGQFTKIRINLLTHWGRDKMADILQTTLPHVFPWMKIFEFGIQFDWSLFLKVQWTIKQYWSR